MEKGGTGCRCWHCEEFAPLLLRLALAGVFLPVGFKKIMAYPESAVQVMNMSAAVVPNWLATFIGYTLPFAELYLGLALLLGFGKYFTRILAIIVTFSLVTFWLLKNGADYEWLSNPHSWYFITALAISGLPAGKASLDHYLWPEKS